jgi:4-carboxymuconolactone decarboxylase
MFLHCPELAGRVAHLGAFVRFEGSLDMRARVLAAMTVAREFEAVYVWGAQTGGARRQGVPEATITAIRENHSRGIPPEDAEIVDFTRQLLRKHRVDEASASALRKRDGERLRARSRSWRRSSARLNPVWMGAATSRGAPCA